MLLLAALDMFIPYKSRGAMKAKKPPIKKIMSETRYTIRLVLRVRIQLAANSGSVGQGKLLARHWSKAPRVSMAAANRKKGTLLLDTQIKPGTFAARDAITLPAPSITSVAGSAQQTSVVVELNSVR